MDHFVYAALALSGLFNAYLSFKFYRKEYVETVDAKRLLSELLRGKAVLEVKVLDAAGLFYRSPRG